MKQRQKAPIDRTNTAKRVRLCAWLLAGSFLLSFFDGAVLAEESEGTDANTSIEETVHAEEGTASEETADTENTEAEKDDTPVFYVKEGGTGSGTSALDASGDIADGLHALAETGGTLYVSGTLDLHASACHDEVLGVFVEPEHAGRIRIEGSDATFLCGENYRCYLSGETVFSDLTFEGSGTLIIAARCHPVIFGEGLTYTGFSDGVCVLGGFNGSGSGMTEESRAASPSVTVQSGEYRYVVGFNRGTTGKAFEGTASVCVTGGQVNVLLAGLAGGSMNFRDNRMGELHVSVLGGSVYKIGESDTALFGMLERMTLDYTGGDIRHVLLSRETDATLYYTKDTAEKAATFLRYFDRYAADGAEMLAVRPLRVACIGDSITLGAGTEEPETDSYPSQLGEMLGEGYEVRNFGEGGKTFSSGAGAYIGSESCKESLAYLPDAVLIMLGTNDLSKLRDGSTDAEKLRGDLLLLIQSYTELPSSPVIYLLSPTPRTDDGELDGILCDCLIPLLSSVSEETHCGFVDLYAVLFTMPEHFPDAFHPDKVACRTIATWLSAVIRGNSALNVADLQTVTPVSVTFVPPQTEPEKEPASDTEPEETTDVSEKASHASRYPLLLIIGILLLSGGTACILVTAIGKERILRSLRHLETALTKKKNGNEETDRAEQTKETMQSEQTEEPEEADK